MDVIKRINALMEERGWSEYRLSQESGLSTSTIANMHRRNTVPSITTLESICNAFGITLAQFFSGPQDHAYVHLSAEQMDMFNDWLSLTSQQKEILAATIREFKKSK